MSYLMHLEEFERDQGPAAFRHLPKIGPDELEAQVKAAYEQGYAAGWDDAIQEEAASNERIGTEFSRNLRDLGFTFHEARNNVLLAMEQFLEELAKSLMPELVRENLGPFLVQEVMAIASDVADCTFEILIPEGTLPLVEQFLQPQSTLGIALREEPSLAAGQALIKAAHRERVIDFDGLIADYSNSLAALFDHVKQERAHG